MASRYALLPIGMVAVTAPVAPSMTCTFPPKKVLAYAVVPLVLKITSPGSAVTGIGVIGCAGLVMGKPATAFASCSVTSTRPPFGVTSMPNGRPVNDVTFPESTPCGCRGAIAVKSEGTSLGVIAVGSDAPAHARSADAPTTLIATRCNSERWGYMVGRELMESRASARIERFGGEGRCLAHEWRINLSRRDALQQMGALHPAAARSHATERMPVGWDKGSQPPTHSLFSRFGSTTTCFTRSRFH